MGNSASALPYSIGKQVSTGVDGWAVLDGSRKSDGATVTVFQAKKPALSKTPVNKRVNPSLMQLGAAWHHFTNCKKLRHPHILQVYATLDTDNPNESVATASSFTTSASSSSETAGANKDKESGDLIIVTEPCIPLQEWLNQNPELEQLAWGLESIVRALHFLHASAGLAHGNLAPHSFMVTPAGDVKLWNFSLLTPVTPEKKGPNRHFIDYEAAVTLEAYRSPERIQRQWDSVATAGVHAMDSYGLGILMQHFFQNGIPPALQKAVQRLLTPSVKMRPRLQPLLKCPVFDTPHQKLQLQLEELTVQPVERKIAFWQNVTPNLQAGLIDEKLAVYKLLPMMKTTMTTICSSDSIKAQDMYRREVQSMLGPMFFIAETYLGDKTAKEIGPIMGMLFGVTDRAVRGTLLKKAGFLADHLNPNTLNQDVFEPTCSGFSDSSAALRELTLKATLDLVPKLTQPNLEKLSRYLVRMQGDAEASIRTNTVIFFSKLAPHLTEISREKLLLPAFIRAMKDPFAPCRLSALQATIAAKEFFDPNTVAHRVLPAVTPQLLDVSPDVRRQAFAVVDDLLFVLRQESERIGTMAQTGATTTADRPVNGGATATAAVSPRAPRGTVAGMTTSPTKVAPAPSSGSYLSGLSSWMSTTTTTTTTATTVAPAPPSAPAMVPVGGPPLGNQSYHSHSQRSYHSHSHHTGNGDVDGWDDVDDLDISEKETQPAAPPAMMMGGLAAAPMVGVPPRPTATAMAVSVSTQEDDFFGSFDSSKAAKPVAMRKPNATGKLAIPAKKGAAAGAAKPAAPVVKKLAVEDSVDDGWDDF